MSFVVIKRIIQFGIGNWIPAETNYYLRITSLVIYLTTEKGSLVNNKTIFLLTYSLSVYSFPFISHSSYIYTRLTVQAKENYFMAVRRHELYNRTDLLGISGGILSLFLSVSLFSITELIFYIVNYFINRRKSTVSIERRVLKNDDLDVDNN